MGTIKSHARNYPLFIDLVIRLSPRGLRERISPRIITNVATASNITPVAMALWRLRPESPAGTALVDPPAIFAGTACVEPGNGFVGDGLESTLAGGG